MRFRKLIFRKFGFQKLRLWKLSLRTGPGLLLCSLLLCSLLLCSLLLSGCTSWAGIEENTFRAKPGASESIRELSSSELAALNTTTVPTTVPTTRRTTKATQPPTKPTFYEGEGQMDRAAIIATLRAKMAELGLNDDSHFSCAFTDLATGETIGLDVDAPFEAASTIKMMAAMFTYEKVASGEADLNEVMTVEEDDLEGAEGTVFTAGVGASFSLANLLHYSVAESDNSANRMVYRYWEGRVPERWLVIALDKRYGLNYNGTKELTARQSVTVLKELYDKRLEISGYQTLLADMKNSSYQNMAQAWLPEAVAQKYGKLGSYYHDIGLCLSATKPFAFAVFSDGIPDPEASIGQLCLAFYNAFVLGQTETAPEPSRTPETAGTQAP